jgi:hypothetical protein
VSNIPTFTVSMPISGDCPKWTFEPPPLNNNEEYNEEEESNEQEENNEQEESNENAARDANGCPTSWHCASCRSVEGYEHG